MRPEYYDRYLPCHTTYLRSSILTVLTKAGWILSELGLRPGEKQAHPTPDSSPNQPNSEPNLPLLLTLTLTITLTLTLANPNP